MKKKLIPASFGFFLGWIACAMFDRAMTNALASASPYGAVPAHCRSTERVGEMTVERIRFSKECQIHLPIGEPF